MVQTYGNSAPRIIIGKELAIINDHYKNIIVIDNDLSTSTKSIDFQKKYPENFWELGIGEQSSMSGACGLALEGFIPVYVNFAIFASGTIWTQLRQTAYAQLNVKVVATHPGLDAGLDGASHQAIQDIAILRAIPNITILTPSDLYDTAAALRFAIENKGLYYVRVSRDSVPEIYNNSNMIYEITNKEVINYGNDVALIFEGSTLGIALESIELLKQHNIKGRLIHARSIKPLDTNNLDLLTTQVKAIITLENHSIIGGLGSAVSEYLASQKNHPPIGIVGVYDQFGSSGDSTLLKQKYGLSSEDILKKASKLLIYN
ncbi:MAG: transketolase family protein [Brevinema sp.]